MLLEGSPCVPWETVKLKHVQLVHQLVHLTCFLENVGELEGVHTNVQMHIILHCLKAKGVDDLMIKTCATLEIFDKRV